MNVSLLTPALFLLLGAGFSHAADPSIESVKCYAKFCVDQEILAPHDGRLDEQSGRIQEIQLETWKESREEPLVVPVAIVRTQSGQTKKMDLRTSIPITELDKPNCLQVTDVKFCKGHHVVVIPDYYQGQRNPVEAEIMGIADIKGHGMPNEPTSRIISVYKSKNGTEFISSDVPGTTKSDACFGTKTKACIGEKYDNGLKSEDEIVAYFPRNKEFLIKLGDLNKFTTVREETIESRKSHRYVLTLTAEKSNVEEAEFLNKDNVKNAKKRVLSIANETCSRAFFGQGVLSPETREPKISNCSKYVEGPGFAHGFYGPSLRVKCEVDFEYSCVHKLR